MSYRKLVVPIENIFQPFNQHLSFWCEAQQRPPAICWLILQNPARLAQLLDRLEETETALSQQPAMSTISNSISMHDWQLCDMENNKIQFLMKR